jgi:hypothetical protein
MKVLHLESTDVCQLACPPAERSSIKIVLICIFVDDSKNTEIRKTHAI